MINNQTQVLKMKDDVMFKAFFSKIGNEEFLKDLLSSILGQDIKIKKVIHDARLEQLAKENKYGILDLEVELESKEIINVEMQLRDYYNIEERTTFYASKKIKEKGIISGAIVGLIYMLILYLISSIVNWDFTMTLETIIMISTGIIGGAIGGIFGVNLKSLLL